MKTMSVFDRWTMANIEPMNAVSCVDETKIAAHANLTDFDFLCIQLFRKIELKMEINSGGLSKWIT